MLGFTFWQVGNTSQINVALAGTMTFAYRNNEVIIGGGPTRDSAN
jgi:hypothetical protein